MKSVNIAKLKSQLSSQLDEVRNGGELVVLDRKTPIAKIIPFEREKYQIRLQSPLKGFEGLKKLRFPPSKLVRSLDLLMEERAA